MTRKSAILRFFRSLLCFPLLLLMGCGSVGAQTPVDADGNPLEIISTTAQQPIDPDPAVILYTAAELEQLVGPYALQPDDLLAIILPASTYPLEIVLAARFLEQLETDPDLTPDESWDESIIALLNYPEILLLMNEEIESTWQLGEAVIAQQTDVLAAVESFRARAHAAGNLVSDEYQNVLVTEETIEITPVDEKVVYVPYYVVEEVIVEQPVAVYHYYPRPRPVYYYPYPRGYHFHSGFFWGVTTAFSIHWSDHYLGVFHHSYHHHPYYGHYYDFGYHHYRRPTIASFNRHYVNNSFREVRDKNRYGSYWRPQRHSGSRPNSSSYRDYYANSSPARERFDEALRNRGSYGQYRSNASNSNLAALSGAGRQNPSARERSLRQGSGRPNTNGARSLSNSLGPDTNTAAITAPDNLTRSSSDRRQSGNRVARPSPRRNNTGVNQGNSSTEESAASARNRSQPEAVFTFRNRMERSGSNRQRTTRNTASSQNNRSRVTSQPQNRQALTAQPTIRQSSPRPARVQPQRSQRSAPPERRREISQPRQARSAPPPQRRSQPSPARRQAPSAAPRRAEAPSRAAPSRAAPSRAAPVRERRERGQDPR